MLMQSFRLLNGPSVHSPEMVKNDSFGLDKLLTQLVAAE